MLETLAFKAIEAGLAALAIALRPIIFLWVVGEACHQRLTKGAVHVWN